MMRGYIWVTFGALGVAFYQMSGGAQYEPVANSIQARAADRISEPAAVQVAALDAQDAGEDENVTRSAASLNELAATTASESYEITLATLSEADVNVPTITAEPARSETVPSATDAAVEAALAEDVLPQEVFSLETYTQASAQGFVTPTPASGDIRQVTGSRVNMRSGPGTDYQRVGSLTKGMEVAVVEEPGNGWIKLEVLDTGETGWMADWLVTASN